ncbi:cytochrome b5 domain-containing protein [Candidatus Accumulibacter sp. ACC003]|uniref:cytochrome b5 domain-containing protein n=1 Tax=Candidatus Accumulibacter sp. ACC003 TaxID=2823334 RepID=UPI0025C65378|nr:cytochrome b5 domain-containing protein [Candidatus Accumulibacter sp. ACC003]
MTRRLFIYATLAFWLAVIGFAASPLWLPAENATAAAAPAPLLDAAVPGALVGTPDNARSLAEVARHTQIDDCWMAIDGEVYDLSNYLPEHPSELEVIVAWCGREATQAYRSKGKGKAHSVRADRLLARYRIATLRRP